jgi:hypothetical protein
MIQDLEYHKKEFTYEIKTIHWGSDAVFLHYTDFWGDKKLKIKVTFHQPPGCEKALPDETTKIEVYNYREKDNGGDLADKLYEDYYKGNYFELGIENITKLAKKTANKQEVIDKVKEKDKENRVGGSDE